MRSFTALALLSAASLASAEAIEVSSGVAAPLRSVHVSLERSSSTASSAAYQLVPSRMRCASVSAKSRASQLAVTASAKAVATSSDKSALNSSLLRRLKAVPTQQTCTFPSNSSPACSSRNVCDYSCGSGYTKETINGSPKCSSSSPSARSLPEKRDLVYWGKQTQSSCRTGWEACGIVGGGPRDWECIDTQNDLESCGGCPIDVMSSLTGANGLGVDCTTIPGVSDVSCIAGTCSVNKCMPGFKISRSGQHCELVEELEQEEENSTVHHSHSHHISHASHKSVHKTTFGNFVEAAVAYLPFSKA
ncbi:hypothetical protein BT96DRAFT_111382 [Gymnopus androsaceus JB14]|uniref:Protein CPL1-like domain-containing protein n=1 Tax=Gymnopus androsaceus JB14 TaxID=1447944 RepID=A0A6A4HDL8_9AGAR|nr:hypothetical protein BT96DRAFT_111382 [Gymnopus androsaceus JB14]